MQTGYLKDKNDNLIYPITSSSCVMTEDGNLDEKLNGLEEKVNNALPKSGGVLSGSLTVKSGFAVDNDDAMAVVNTAVIDDTKSAVLDLKLDSSNRVGIRVSRTSDNSAQLTLHNIVNNTNKSYNIFGEHNRNSLPICTFINGINFQYNDSVVARVGGHGDSSYHNAWIDAINDGKTATRFQIRKKMSDGSVDVILVNQNNGAWEASMKMYGEHNITVSTTAPSSALPSGAMHMTY